MTKKYIQSQLLLSKKINELMIVRILVHICCAPCFTFVHQDLSGEGHEILGYFFNPNIHPYQEFLKRLHCLQRYTSLRPVEVVFDKEYDLDKYLVGALQARYDTPAYFKKSSIQRKGDGSFQEKIEVKESLQIKLTPRNDTEGATMVINVKENITKAQDALNRSKDNGPGLAEGIHGVQDQEKMSNSDLNPRCGYCIALRLAKTVEYAAANGFDGFTTTLLLSKYQPHDYIHTIGEQLAAKHGVEFYYKDFRIGWKESIRLSKELELYRQQYCGCIFSEYERFGTK
jgi:predicted adenine nucleotide alpha hydrolase (AANH) superfamily ATPase